MTEKLNNPPAFPQCLNPEGPFGGMTLRDWFAGQALVGLLAGAYRDTTEYNLSELPAEAFKISNCMLAERERTS